MTIFNNTISHGFDRDRKRHQLINKNNYVVDHISFCLKEDLIEDWNKYLMLELGLTEMTLPNITFMYSYYQLPYFKADFSSPYFYQLPDWKALKIPVDSELINCVSVVTDRAGVKKKVISFSQDLIPIMNNIIGFEHSDYWDEAFLGFYQPYMVLDSPFRPILQDGFTDDYIPLPKFDLIFNVVRQMRFFEHLE